MERRDVRDGIQKNNNWRKRVNDFYFDFLTALCGGDHRDAANKCQKQIVVEYSEKKVTSKKVLNFQQENTVWVGYTLSMPLIIDTI